MTWDLVWLRRTMYTDFLSCFLQLSQEYLFWVMNSSLSNTCKLKDLKSWETKLIFRGAFSYYLRGISLGLWSSTGWRPVCCKTCFCYITIVFGAKNSMLSQFFPNGRWGSFATFWKQKVVLLCILYQLGNTNFTPWFWGNFFPHRSFVTFVIF